MLGNIRWEKILGWIVTIYMKKYEEIFFLIFRSHERESKIFEPFSLGLKFTVVASFDCSILLKKSINLLDSDP